MGAVEHGIERMVGLLPGKSEACRGCVNRTDAFGCKIDVQAGFYLSEENAGKKNEFAHQLAAKAARMPPGCPIQILLEKKEN